MIVGLMKSQRDGPSDSERTRRAKAGGLTSAARSAKVALAEFSLMPL